MRWLMALKLVMVLLAMSGCALGLNPNPHPQAPIGIEGESGELSVRAQVADAIETVGVDRLHELGLSGEGVSILLIAPFKDFRSGASVPVGFYLEQIVSSIAPGAQVLSCDTGGSFFSLKPVQLVDCLLEALSVEPDVVVVGAMGWGTLRPECEDRLDGRINRSGLLIFAGAGDYSSDGLAYPACARGVIPVLATYDTNQSGNLPFLRNCWRESIHKDEPACFTNYLSDRALLAAPGAIIEVGLFGVEIPYCCSTAISATIVGAAVALLLEAHPTASPSQIRQALRETGVPVLRRGEALGVRISASRAHRWLEEHLSEPEPLPDPEPQTVNEFDENGNCLIDTDEFLKAMDAWMGGLIESEIFYEVMDAWISQTDICK
jgi:hypothetical protein